MQGKKGTHRRVYIQKRVYTGKVHMKEYIRRRAYSKNCTHRESTDRKSIRKREYIWRSLVYTEEKVYTPRSTYRKECI